MYFPILAILACFPALIWPEVLVLFKSAIIPMLALIMFSMGLTQTKQDFLRVLSAPKAIGLGLAIAVLVDVTLVRALVAPAIMRIAGPWNWWLPGWLDRILPEVHHDA